MPPEEIFAFTTETFTRFAADVCGDFSWTDDQIRVISQAAAGHPMIAVHMVSYILTNLVEEYGQAAVEEFVKNVDYAEPKERAVLLSHKLPL
jgi:hypothetical protein